MFKINYNLAIQCKNGNIYHSCGSFCQKTCFDDAEFKCEKEECTEGCFCPENMVLNENGMCIEKNKCSCKDNGIIYYNKQTFLKSECEIW